MKINSSEIIISPIEQTDRDDLLDLWREQWGGDLVVAHGRVFYVNNLPGFVARFEGRLVGAVTYWIEQQECELISLNSLEENKGIGSRLVDEVERIAKGQGCLRLFLITTNDNLDALRWYQKRGFRLAALRPGAVDEARQIKPGIPLVGDANILIHDELELEKRWI